MITGTIVWMIAAKKLGGKVLRSANCHQRMLSQRGGMELDNNTLGCGHDHCGTCCGGSCGGCGGQLELTQKEVELLRLFAQIPFLPVARRRDSETPVFLENGADAAEACGAAITALYQKRLIQLDYDLPLLNFDYGEYSQYPCRGSMALTAMGQTVVELLEIQGVGLQ